MKALILLITLLSLNSFAAKSTVLLDPNIQVTIDGRVYNCSGNNSNPDPGAICRNVASKATAKYTACKNAGYSGPSCFNEAFNKKVADCDLWSEQCNTTCKEAGYSGQSCYSSCY